MNAEIGGDDHEGSGATDLAENRSEQKLVERLRQAVEQGGGPTRVARLSGIPLRTLQNYLSGRGMKAIWLGPLADACGVNADWLATGRGVPALPKGFAEAASGFSQSQSSGAPTPPDLDHDLLTRVIREALELARMIIPGGPPPPEWIAAAAARLYATVFEDRQK